MSTSVEYRKLDITINEIRLLRLLPASASPSDAPVQYMLEYHPLASPPPYTALSYHWGDKDDTVPILVGGDTFLATRNLENALRNLRTRDVTHVWADAICINQNDVVERGEQINRMGAIYQCAENVSAWLGDNVDVQNKVFPLMKRIHDTSPIRPKKKGPMVGKLIPWLQLLFDAENSRPVRIGEAGSTFYLEDRDDDDEVLQAMTEFFEIPYWKRVWIIQELAFGTDVQLLCGHKSIPFNYLAKTIELAENYGGIGDSEEDRSFDNVRQIKELRSKIEASIPVSLLEAMARSARAESSEIKDRLYSLLSLAFDGSRYVPVPSYLMSIPALCQRVSTQAMKTSLANIVIFCNMSGMVQEPTWIPNWLERGEWARRNRTKHLLFPEAEPNGRQCRCLCRCWKLYPNLHKWQAHGDTVPEYTIDGNVLRAKGQLLFKIRKVSSTLAEASLPDVEPPQPSKESPKTKTSNYYLFNQLYKLLTFADLTCVCENCFDDYHNLLIDFRYMFQAKKKAGLQQLAPTVSAWFEVNKAFDIFGRGLEDRAAHPKGLRDRYYFVKPHERAYDFGGNTIGALFAPLVHISAALGQPNRYLTDRIQTILGLGMRFATCGNRSLGWVDALARPGDWIGVLQGCSIPVVLRPREAGGWNLVGDAIVCGLMNFQYRDFSTDSYLDIH